MDGRRPPRETSASSWEASSRLQSVSYGGNKWDESNEQRTTKVRRSPPPELPSESGDIGFQFAPRPIATSNRARASGTALPSPQLSSGLGNEQGRLGSRVAALMLMKRSRAGSILERLQRRRRIPIKAQEGQAQTHASLVTIPAGDSSDKAAGTEVSVPQAPNQHPSQDQKDGPTKERAGSSKQVARYAKARGCTAQR